jgi:hypothetical protein
MVVVWRIATRHRIVDVDSRFITLAWVAKLLEDVVADVPDRFVAVTSIYHHLTDAMIPKTLPMHIAITSSIDFVRIDPVVGGTASFLARAR